MKPANLRMLHKLQRRTQPTPEPDFTGWTSLEITTWRLIHGSLADAVRQSQELDDEDRPLPEALDARDARDEAILAKRRADAADEQLRQRPGSAAAQLKARAAREEVDKANRLADEAERRAEEAARRPRPPKPAVEPQVVAECQRRGNSDPPLAVVAEVKLTHPGA